MNIKIIRKKDINFLKKELLSLLKEQFNLKIQLSSKKLNRTHLLKKNRRNISRIKMVLSEKEKK
ncbi:MAG: 50S ribosomal protein L29 [Buchnera aphidicola (Periphyllus lyropictus)]|uniref:50S ribosomal protein L29 n=1 Tax=Buchnera aphidicola TaxID=9 RepID=UPI001ED618A1|nr:50S ribosomal protein L29 [Buchnera aphidicola]NIH16481.1 50S ribosomal protein L29 [Buchnera aphidicola (Periphyllus lyropictus)]USS94766.1 50S ribosomal protein L29 [Buchnera aphidicola (Periphyllus lyropictus)]